MAGMSVTEGLVRSAAADLEAAADAIEAMLTATSLARGSAPSGIDEASTTITSHLNSAVGSHDSVALAGIKELRQAAHTLRKHAVQYGSTDDTHRGVLGAILG